MPSILEHETHFQINGMIANKRAACGGVLFVKKVEIRALFSGPICGENRFLTGINARPWGLAKEFATLDVLRNGIAHIQLRQIERSDNLLAARLAQDGLSRLNWFKAWW
ncbi:hypothetical protein V6N13_139405 [Hibiscus sabdariffa]